MNRFPRRRSTVRLPGFPASRLRQTPLRGRLAATLSNEQNQSAAPRAYRRASSVSRWQSKQQEDRSDRLFTRSETPDSSRSDTAENIVVHEPQLQGLETQTDSASDSNSNSNLNSDRQSWLISLILVLVLLLMLGKVFSF